MSKTPNHRHSRFRQAWYAIKEAAFLFCCAIAIVILWVMLVVLLFTPFAGVILVIREVVRA